MAESGITIKVTLDSSQVQQGLAPLNNLSAAFSTLDAKVQQTAATTSSASAKMSAGLQSLANQIRPVVISQTELGTAFLKTGQAAGASTVQLQKLPGVYSAVGASARTAAAGVTEATTAMSQSARGLGAIGAALRNVAAAFGVTVGVGALLDFTKSIVEAGIAHERLMLSLKGALGTAKAAGEAYTFVEGVANRLGIGLQTAGESFARLSAATQGTVVQGQQTRDLFVAISEASRVMGLRTEEVGGVVTAVTQIIGKNTVSMEELRQQLGERLPAALRLTAKEMGVTTSRFIEMVSKGEVLATEFIPAFTRAMQEMGKEAPAAAQSVQAALARMGNAWLQLKITIAQSGLLELVASIAEQMTVAINQTTNWINRTKRLAGESGIAAMRQELSRLNQEIQDIQSNKDPIFAGMPETARSQERLKLLTTQVMELSARIIQAETAQEQYNQTTGKAIAQADEATKNDIANAAAKEAYIASVKKASAALISLDDDIKDVELSLKALRSFDVESLQALRVDPFAPDFEQQFNRAEALLLKRHKELLDKRAGLDKSDAARAVREAGQSAVERAKAAEDVLATQLKREETMIEQSALERRRIIDETAVSALAAAGPAGVEAVAAQRLQDLRRVATETAQALESLRLDTLTKQQQAREATLQAEIAAAGKNLSAAVAAQEELRNLEADTAAKRLEITQKRAEAEGQVSKKSAEDQIKTARDLNKIIQEIEDDRLQARIDQVDEQVALIEAQMEGELITTREGLDQIYTLRLQQFDNVRLQYERQAQVAIDAVNREVQATAAGSEARVQAEAMAQVQIEKIRQGLATNLEAVNLQQQALQQEHQNELTQGWRDWARDVESALGTFLSDWMSGEVDSIEDVLDGLKNYFFKVIADMVAYAATQQIIIPILAPLLSGLFGGGGAGGTASLGQAFAQAMGLGGAGGAGGGGTGMMDILGLAGLGTQLSGLFGPQSLLGQSFSYLNGAIVSTGEALQSLVGVGIQPTQAMLESALVETGAGITSTAPMFNAVNPMVALGGLGGMAGGIFSAITAKNTAGRVGGAIGAAGGAVALAVGLGLISTGILAPIGLAVAALAPFLGNMIGDMIKEKGPRLVMGELEGLGVAFEEGALRVTGDLTSQLLRRERLPADVSGFQGQLEDSLTGVVQGMLNVINAVAEDTEALLGSTQDALSRALNEAMTINTSSVENFQRDLEEQGRFLSTQLASFFLRPLNEAFRQLEGGDLEEQVSQLPGTVQGLVQVFQQMNTQVNDLANVANTDVLRQLSSVRNRVEDFGNALADTARVIATDIVDQLEPMFAAPLPDTQAALDRLDMTVAERITELHTQMEESLIALGSLRATATVIEGAGLPAGGVQDQITRLMELMSRQAATIAQAIVTQSLGELSRDLQQVLVQPMQIQASTVGTLFNTSLAALQALWGEWHRLADAGLDITEIQAQFTRLLSGVLDTAFTLVSNAWDPNQFDAFLGVLIAIPEAVAAMNPTLQELRQLGLAFAAVVGPNVQRIEQLEAALRTPAETAAITEQRVQDLRDAIRDAGTAVEQILPLYDQLSQAIVANAEAEIAMVRAVGEEIAQTEALVTRIDTILRASTSSAEQLADVQRRIGEELSRQRPILPESGAVAAPTTEDIGRLVSLYEEQLALLGQMRSLLESAIDSIDQTLRAQLSLSDQITATADDIARIIGEMATTGLTAEGLADVVGLLQTQLGLVQQLIGAIESGLASIEDTLLGMLSLTEQAAALQEQMQQIMNRMAQTGLTTEGLLELVPLTQQALSLQQQISESLRQSLEATRQTIHGAISPAAAIAETRSEIATLMEKVAAGTATPEELAQLVTLNQELLRLGEESKLLNVQEEALNNLRRLEPLLADQLTESENMEQVLVDQLKSLQTALEGQLEGAKALEQQIIDQLGYLRTILAEELAKVVAAEDATLLALKEQKTILEAQLAVLHRQLEEQYGTHIINDIIRLIQERARDELIQVNRVLADLFASQEVMKQAILGGSPADAAQTHYLSQTAANTGKLNQPMQLDEPVGIQAPPQGLDVRIVYMQSSYAQRGGIMGLASGVYHAQRGGLMPVMLEPGEVGVPGPLTTTQGHAIEAMNAAFPRFGSQAMLVSGIGSGDTVPALIPQGSGILNREAAGALGYQRGALMPAGGMAWLPHVTSPPRPYQEGGTVTPGPTTVTIHVDLRGSTFSKNITLEEFKALMETLQRRRL